MTKDEVLSMLQRADDYLSGEKISALLGVSRTAVNVAVKALRAEGYEISSSTKKGYLLLRAPDHLTAGALGAYLSRERMKSVLCLASVDSTNKKLQDLAFEGAPDGQVVLADQQISGRGRAGRSFASPAEHGIYLSMLFRPDAAASDVTTLTAWTAVAVSNAIRTVCGVTPGIKWVNDLVLNRKKICGILTELSLESESGRIRHIIIGVGVNVREQETDFPEELRPVATSLARETGKQILRSRLAAEMIREMDAMCAAWPREKQAYLEDYRSRSVTVGQEVTVLSGSNTEFGTALGIEDDFSLRIRMRGGEERSLSSGEVSVRGLYGYV